MSIVSDASDSVCGHRCGQKYPPPHGSIEPVEEDFYVLDCNLETQGCQVISLFSKEDAVEPYFLYSYIRTSEFYKTMSNHMTGSSQPTIPMKTIRVLKVPVPPMDTQKKVASMVLSINQKIKNNTEINKNLAA